MKISKRKRLNDGYCYVCTRQTCKKALSIMNCFSKSLKLSVHKFLRAIFAFVSNYDISQSISICEISSPSYIKVKYEIIAIIKEINANFEKIGGSNIEVQLDETAICNGKIISDPSNLNDNLEGIQWIFGGIANDCSGNLFLKLVPNRKHQTLTSVLNDFVQPGSLIVTDGYPSYVQAIRNFGSVHKVVNHTTGFVNQEGFHTNLIENVWSHFKNEYKSRHGLPHEKISSFIEEFIFRKRNLKSKTMRERIDAFKLILVYLFEKTTNN